MGPFADTGDLRERYPVDFGPEGSEERAMALLAAASRLVRRRVPSVDSRSDLDTDLLADVVCEMVWIAVQPGVTPGATSSSRSVGSVSVSVTYEEAAGRLTLSRAQLDLLRPLRSRARAGHVSSLPSDALRGRGPGAEGSHQGYGP